MITVTYLELNSDKNLYNKKKKNKLLLATAKQVAKGKKMQPQ